MSRYPHPQGPPGSNFNQPPPGAPGGMPGLPPSQGLPRPQAPGIPGALPPGGQRPGPPGIPAATSIPPGQPGMPPSSGAPGMPPGPTMGQGPPSHSQPGPPMGQGPLGGPPIPGGPQGQFSMPAARVPTGNIPAGVMMPGAGGSAGGPPGQPANTGGPPMGGPPTLGGPPMAGGPPSAGHLPIGRQNTMSAYQMQGQPQGPPPPSGPPPPTGPPMGPPGGQPAGPPGSQPPQMYTGAGQPGQGGRPLPHGYGGVTMGGADVDQPLADKFLQLNIGGGGPGAPPGTPAIQEGQLPRPELGDLVVPPRWDCRPDGDSACQSDPKFMRLSVNAIPNSAALKTKSGLPFGAVLQPLAQMPQEKQVPVVSFGPSGVVRCRRCRTYINPFVKFVEGGRRWACNVCGLINEVNSDYFCTLDGNGDRRDKLERPELSCGCVEFIAPQEYMVRPPQPPIYCFLIDVSYPSVQSGMLKVVTDAILASLDKIPGDTRTQIAFITFDSTIHFYSLKSTLTTPQMVVVPEIDEVFLPLPEDMLVNLSESKEVVRSLLTSLPEMFKGSQNAEACLGPALKSAYQVIQHLGGKLILFSSTLASLGEGRLKNREQAGGLQGNAQRNLLVAEEPFYKKQAVEMSRQQICVDVFLFHSHYADVATVAQLSKHTCGQVYFYPAFHAQVDAQKLYSDVCRNLTREQGWEAVMRIRASSGLRISNFHGHFFIRGTDLLALPNVDADKAFAVQLAHEENLLTQSHACIQSALLYTTSSGERRIRVCTMQMPVTRILTDLFKYTDVDTSLNLLTKAAIDQALASKVQEAREALQNKVVELMRCYRSLCPPQARNGNSLILPENLKLFPLYMLALLRHPVFSQANIRSDERAYLMHQLNVMPVGLSTSFLHPLLYRVHPMPEVNPGELPAITPLVQEKLATGGAFLLDDTTTIYLWISRVCKPEFMQAVFNVPSLEGVNPAALHVPAASSPNQAPLLQSLNTLISTIRSSKPTFQPLKVVVQGDQSEQLLLSKLVEDRTVHSMSYEEWLTHLHRKILNKVA